MKNKILASLLMILILLFTCNAFATEPWQDIQISLSYLQNDELKTIVANPIQGDTKHSYEAIIEQGVNLEALTLNVFNNMQPNWTYTPNNGSVLTNVVDAMGNIQANSVQIQVLDENNALVDTLYLYITSSAIVVLPQDIDNGENANNLDTGIDTSIDNAGNNEGFENVDNQNNGANVPEEVQPALITVNYLDDQDNIINTSTITLPDGQHEVQADESFVSEDYVAIDNSPKYVEVSNGVANPSTVVFRYQKQVSSASLTINYVDTNGQTIASDNVVLDKLGTNEVYPNFSIIPQDYFLDDDASKTVELLQNGSVSQNPIEFRFKHSSERQSEVNIDVKYLDENQSELASEVVSINQIGSNNITANTNLIPEGYKLKGNNVAVVEIFADGSVSRSAIAFELEKIIKEVNASINVSYINSFSGDQVALPTQVTISNIGENIITPEYPSIDGYELEGSGSATVYLYQDGTFDPSEVYFTYKPVDKAVVDASLPKGEEPNATSNESFENENVATEDLNTEASETITEPSNNLVNPQDEINNRYAISLKKVNLRKEMSTKSDKVDTIAKEEYVWVKSLHTDSDGKQWAEVIYNGKQGYVVVEFLNILTEEESYKYNSAQPTMVPGSENIAPPEATEEVTPETTPEVPTQPDVNARVAVKYVDESNQVIYETEVYLKNLGDNVVEYNPDPNLKDYELVGDSQVHVFVQNENTAEPSEVIFNLKAIKFEASFTIHYIDENGNNIAEDTKQIFNAAGEYEVHPNANIDQKYELIEPFSYWIVVNDRGESIPADVSFKYRLKPVVANLSVKYLDQDGNALAEEQNVQINKIGENQILPNANISSEYSLVGEQSFIVNLDENGNLSPSEVVFRYQKQEISHTASLIVHYNDNHGQKIAEDTQQIIDKKGANVVIPSGNIPSGYSIIGPQSFEVIMDDNGNLDVPEVTFTYENVVEETQAPTAEPIVTQDPSTIAPNRSYNITFRYVDSDFNKLAEDDIKLIEFKENTVVLNSDKTFEGYNLENPNFQISLNENGIPDTDEAIFIYTPNKPAVISVVVGVHYFDQNGIAVAPSTSVTLNTPGDNIIAANPQGLDQKYQLVGEATQTVYVSQSGIASTDNVVFTYKNTDNDFEHYSGYALTNSNAALRNAMNNLDGSIVKVLPRNTILYISGQQKMDGILYHSVQTLNGENGFMMDGDISRISNDQAQTYIDQYYASLNPQPQATPTVAPLTGFARTLGYGVPLRTVASAYSQTLQTLPNNAVVYITSTEYNENTAWRIVNYNGQIGYIRHDQLAPLSPQEAAQYANSNINANATPVPYTPNSPSSYGYVTSNGVNFRIDAGLKSRSIGKLNKFGFAMVLGSKQVDNVTWYKVNYNGKEGYVHGDFFKVLSLSEMQKFLNSQDYSAGIRNNLQDSSWTSNTNYRRPTTNAGIAAPGNVASLEDYNVDKWKNPNLLNVSYEPFSPYTTPKPSDRPEASPTPTMIVLESSSPLGYGGELSPSPSILPEDTEQAIDPNVETSQSSITPILIVLFILGLSAIAAVAYVSIMKKKRAQMIQEAREAQIRQRQALNNNMPPKAQAPNNMQAMQNRPNAQSMPNYQVPQQAAKPIQKPAIPYAQRKPIQTDIFMRPSPEQIEKAKREMQAKQAQNATNQNNTPSNFETNKPQATNTKPEVNFDSNKKIDTNGQVRRRR